MPKKILVIDDEPKIVEICMDYLHSAGFDVVTAADGVQGLAQARLQKPDLVVLDLMLPGMDGLDVCRSLRRESNIPIIMLTARIDETDKLIGLELGQTITSQSRSARANWWRGSAPCCGGLAVIPSAISSV